MPRKWCASRRPSTSKRDSTRCATRSSGYGRADYAIGWPGIGSGESGLPTTTRPAFAAKRQGREAPSARSGSAPVTSLGLARYAKDDSMEYRDERDLHIYTDGSSYSGPRRGGIGIL